MNYRQHIRSSAALGVIAMSLCSHAVSLAETKANKDPFGNTFKRDVVRLVLNDKHMGLVTVEASIAGYAKIEPTHLQKHLSPYLSADQNQYIETFGLQPVLLEHIRRSDLPIVFDPGSQTVKVTLVREDRTAPHHPKLKTDKAVNTVKKSPAHIKPKKDTASPNSLQTNKGGEGRAVIKTAQISGKPQNPDIAATDEDFFPLELPLNVNRSYLGDISAEATLSGLAKIDVTRLIELLDVRLSEDQLGKLSAYKTQYIRIDRLNLDGFIIVYDASELSVKLTLPREGVSLMSLSGQSLQDFDFDSFQKPSNFSAGASFIMRPRYVHESEFGETGFAPLSANVRGFFAAGGFKSLSLVYELDAVEGREQTIRRGDFTLIKDDFKNAVRYQAGDIRPSISGFQNGFNILGIGFERNYGAIQPFRNLRPNGRTQFTLERAARVNFEVNGTITSSEFLEPGDYDISNFPLLTGANDVRIIIDDEFGSREVGSYSTFVDSDLLSAGTTLFGANIGVLREGSRTGFSPNYGNDILATAFYEKAISDKFTLGAQAEASSNGAYIGTNAVRSFGQNIFAFEAGVSAFDGFNPGYALALQYRYRPERARTRITHDIIAQFLHQNDSFQTIGSLGNSRGKIWQVAVSDSIRFNNYSINLTGSWRRDTSDDTLTASPSISFPFKGVSLSLGYQGVYRKSSQNLDNRFFITLSKNFGNAGTVRSRSRSGPLETELEWQRLSNREVGAWSGRAGYIASEIEDELSVDASFIASRAEIDISHTSVLRSGFGAALSSVTDARVGLGFGYADGALAIGRPVSDGFFIVESHPTLKGKTIKTMQRSGRVQGITDKFGPGLVPLNTPYTENVHRFNVQDLPAGVDIGADEVKVFPSQNSGYKLRVGADPSALVIGRLHTKDGQAVALSVGQLIALDKPDAKPIEFFTNRTGRFVAERVPPGRYALILMPDGTHVTELDIGGGEDGVVQIGTITTQEDAP